MHLRTKIMFSILFILLLIPALADATYIALDVPKLRNSVVLVTDLYGQGELNLIFGQGHNVSLFQENEVSVLIEGISGRVTAIAVGDVNGDLRNDLVVGTDNGGALYFYTEKDGIWQRQGHPQYLWGTIQRLEVHDFNNDGWGDVLVLTGTGEAQVLLSFEGTLQPLWKSRPGDIVTGIEVVDLDHDGHPELVYAISSGYIGVLKWDGEEFTTLWENYPWGSIESLVIVPHQSSPEWLVVTSQKMVYGWRFRNGEVVSSRLFESKELGEHLFYYPGEGLLSFSQKTGISLFELHSTSVSEKWRVPGLFGTQSFLFQDDFYFRDERNGYYRLSQGSAQWRIFLHDQEITQSIAFFDQEGDFFYSLTDFVEILGLVGGAKKGWSYVYDGHQIEFLPNQSFVQYDDLLIPMKFAILDVNGLPYVSSEVFSLFGWRAEVDLARQHVVFVQNWGWWL